MKKLLLVVLVVALGGCSAAVRDEVVYQTELNFNEQVVGYGQADLLEKWIQQNCQCVNEPPVFTTALCEHSAKFVQVIRSRLPWHKEMMLYNGGIIDKRPSKTPPEVPAPTDLCPNR